MQVIREPLWKGLRAAVPIRAAAVFLLLVLNDLPAAAQDDGSATLGTALGEILSAGAPPVTDIDAAIGSESIAELKNIYAARNDRPIWLGTDAARGLLDRLSQSDVTIGPKLQPLLEGARKKIDAADASTRAGADLLLTALYGATAQALRPNAPVGFAAALAELSTTGDLTALLREPELPTVEKPPSVPVEAPAVEPPKAPASAAPPESPEALRLKAALASLKDWPSVPDGPKLQLGDTGSRVTALSRRLIASGDLIATAPANAFDAALKRALEHFQARHGLPGDGVAGAATIAALNVPAKDRAASLSRKAERSAECN